MNTEQRAINKISKVLSKLDPEAAARVAEWAAQRFAAGSAPAKTEDTGPPATEPPRPDEAKQAAAPETAPRQPSFMQTEFRIAVGKELLEQEKTAKTAGK